MVQRLTHFTMFEKHNEQAVKQYFPDEQIVVSLILQLSWSHFVALIPLKTDLQRDFYAEICRIENWNVRTLRSKTQAR